MKEVSTLKATPALKQKRDISYQPLIAFLIASICYLLMLVISDKYPIGNKDFLVSDLDAQYAPFLFFFKKHITDAFKGGHIINALTYSFGLGMGRNVMSTFGYYLASPFNLLVFLFNNTQVNEFVMILVGLRLALSASFMTMYLRTRSSNLKSRMHILFGLIYAFSSYTMVYMFQIMWLDGYMLLPLLLLFIEKYLKTGKVKGIIFTLLFLFWSNYYIAYMVGVFSFLYIIERMYVSGEFAVMREGMKKIGKFIAAAAFSAMTIGFMIIPVALDTLGSADVAKKIEEPNLVKFAGINMIDQLFAGYPGKFADVLPNNLPLVFMSLSVTLLCIIYFVSPVFKGKERRIRAVGFAVSYVSMAIHYIDIAWQAFDSPNWFYHRYSFVFMPLFLVTAFHAFERIKEVPNRDIKRALGIALAMLFVTQSFGAMNQQDEVFLVNVVGVLAFTAIFIGMKRQKWPNQLRNMNKLLAPIMAIIVVFEVCGITQTLSGGVSTLSVYYGEGAARVQRLEALNDCALASDMVNNGGFRDENVQFGVGVQDNTADGSFYCGYNGVSFFNSNSNKNLHHFLKQFGYRSNYNYFALSYAFEAPDTDAFLSVKTFIDKNDYSYGTFVGDDPYGQGYGFYINPTVLPLAFQVQKGAFDFDFYSLERQTQHKDYFGFRNNWYRSMFGDVFSEDFYRPLENDPAFELVNGQVISLADYVAQVDKSDEDMSSASDASMDPDPLGQEPVDFPDGVTTYYRNNENIPMILNYTFTSESEDEMYMAVAFPRLCTADIGIYVNGQYTSDLLKNSFYSTAYRIGSFPVGEQVQVSIVVESPSIELMNLDFAYMDNNAFTSQFSQLDTSNVIVDQAQNGYVSITSDLTGDDMILTTIPYEKGWKLYIDGAEQEISIYQDALIGINPGAGHHDIELVFECPGLKLGAIVSVIGVLGFIGMAVYTKKKQNKPINK